MAQALFITRDDIVKFTALNGNIDTDKFIQYIKIAQDIHIQNYIGTKLYNKINDDIVANTLVEPYTSLLSDYIKMMVIHWSMVEFLPYSAIKISEKGVFKHNSENSTNVDKNEIDFLIEKERDVAQSYTNRFIDYMSFNQSSFPEYNTNSNADMFPDRDANFTGWIL
jgi:DNA integrity scanning protein DisA with diadenylate cyclase activity